MKNKYALCKSELEGFRKNNCYLIVNEDWKGSIDEDNIKLVDGNKIERWVDAKDFEIVPDIFADVLNNMDLDEEKINN